MTSSGSQPSIARDGRVAEADQVVLADHQHDVGRRLPQQAVALGALAHEALGEAAFGDVLQRAAQAHHAPSTSRTGSLTALIQRVRPSGAR
jgi:hypothetical protein